MRPNFSAKTLADLVALALALVMAPARRVAVLPEVPSIADQGYPSYNIRAWYGLLAKAGTPPEINRHRGQQLAAPLPHHRACGSAPGGSWS